MADVLVVVTVTSTAPTVCDGLVAIIDVGDATVTLIADVVPNRTMDELSKFVPVIVTLVPPACVPLDGLIDVTVGAGTT